MAQELRMLLKVSIHAIRSPSGEWNASFMDKGYKASADNPFEAIRLYMNWAEERLSSGDDKAIASDLGIGEEWITSLKEVLKTENHEQPHHDNSQPCTAPATTNNPRNVD